MTNSDLMKAGSTHGQLPTYWLIEMNILNTMTLLRLHTRMNISHNRADLSSFDSLTV